MIPHVCTLLSSILVPPSPYQRVVQLRQASLAQAQETPATTTTYKKRGVITEFTYRASIQYR
nr:hypothetical protein Q903MT_gene5042 [Picea sitchensis]